MTRKRGSAWEIGIVVLAVLALGVSFQVGHLTAQVPLKIRWQITGEASAKAEDGSVITLTGNGNFTAGSREDVSGGGSWIVRSASGEITGNGTYIVMELLGWQEAPSTSIGADRAGLVLLRIKYSSGSEGFLFVSCHLAGSPESVFEGITASMGFVQFWNHGTRTTLFTVSE